MLGSRRAALGVALAGLGPGRKDAPPRPALALALPDPARPLVPFGLELPALDLPARAAETDGPHARAPVVVRLARRQERRLQEVQDVRRKRQTRLGLPRWRPTLRRADEPREAEGREALDRVDDGRVGAAEADDDGRDAEQERLGPEAQQLELETPDLGRVDRLDGRLELDGGGERAVERAWASACSRAERDGPR